MAGLDVAASIVGIACAGIKLTNALYEFSSNLASAKDHIDDIIFEVTTYSGTMKELAARLEDEDSVHSEHGLLLATSLRDRTDWLFGQILSSLPRKELAEKMTAIQRLKWHFKKGRVEWLVAKLQGLKLSLLVLIQALYAGRVIVTAREKKDNSVAMEERIDLEKTHLSTLLVQRRRLMSRMPDLEDTAEKDEKAMIDASPSGPPKDFVPIATKSLALIKYEADPLAAIDAAQDGSESPNAQAVVLHDPKHWSDFVIGDLTIALLPDLVLGEHLVHDRAEAGVEGDRKQGSDEMSSKRLPRSRKSEEDSSSATRRTRSKKDGRHTTVRSLSEEDIRTRQQHPPDSLHERGRSTDYGDEIKVPEVNSHSTTQLNRSGSPARLSRASTAVERSSSHKSRSTRQLKGDDYTPLDLDRTENASKPKYGIKWRRGRGPVKGSVSPGPTSDHPGRWREFEDEKLVDFDVSNASLNITENDFKGLDKWTEVKVSHGKISWEALDHMCYPFYEYDRYVKTVQPRDSEGNATGPSYDVFEVVYHIDLPLLFTEMLDLARVTYRITKDIPQRLNWWHLPTDRPPQPRHELELRDDLPYPHAPLGRKGFKAGRMLNKGTRWLNLGNYVISSLANGGNVSNSQDVLPSILQAVSRGGKGIPAVGGRDGGARLDWSNSDSTRRHSTRVEEVEDG